MNFFGAPNLAKTCQRINAATPSAVIDSLQGMRIITLEQSWSVMVRIVLYPPDWGNFVMKSIAIVWNGSECLGVMSQTKVLVRDGPIQSHFSTRETSAGHVPLFSLTGLGPDGLREIHVVTL